MPSRQSQIVRALGDTNPNAISTWARVCTSVVRLWP
jgi:hypothetical protein